MRNIYYINKRLIIIHGVGNFKEFNLFSHVFMIQYNTVIDKSILLMLVCSDR